MTDTWVPSTDAKAGDIIRWTEPLRGAPTQKRGLPDQIGERQVTALIQKFGKSVELKVLAAEIVSLIDGVADAPLKVSIGDIIQRKYETLERGDCHTQIIEE